MEKMDSVVMFSLFFVVLIVLMGLYLFFYERRKKVELKMRFRNFQKEYDFPGKDLRAVPRISVPDSLDVILTLEMENEFFKAYATDISLTGFSVEPEFSLKKLAPGIILKNVRVETVINGFFIRELKVVRMERRSARGSVALYILGIGENEFEELKSLIKYLDKFLIHEHNKN